jgi:hypothetical protein
MGKVRIPPHNRDCSQAPASSISASMPARAMPVITTLWCGPTQHWTGNA